MVVFTSQYEQISVISTNRTDIEEEMEGWVLTSHLSALKSRRLIHVAFHFHSTLVFCWLNLSTISCSWYSTDENAAILIQ